MAEGVIVEIAKTVVGKLGRIIVNEANLVLDFQDDFKWLQTQFTSIYSYQLADEQSALNDSAKQWLSDVSDIYLDAEDIIDECTVEPLYTTPTQSCFYCLGKSNFRRKMGKRIQLLKARLNSSIQKLGELILVGQVLNSNQASTTTPEMTGWTALEEEDSRAVGLEEKVEDIEKLLEDAEIGVVAVVGMGGLGKTFLLKNVYERVKGRYELCAWISVSQTYSLAKLQSDLASNIQLEMPHNVTDFRAAELIKDKLHGSTCLIVLDDVWESSVDGELISRLGLPTGRNSQCRIVVTTRSRDVAGKMSANEYEMQPLSEEDSWKLFCLFAFPGSEESRPPEHLESVAHEIVKECGSLPLALKTVAASMASCSDLQLWQSKLRKLKDATGAKNSTMQILKLSYDTLPPYLKPCFAYLSFFPEDTQIFFNKIRSETDISQEYLIYLWIAEGLVPQEKDMDQHDNGLIYLQKLTNLCLLEVDRILGYYHIHDLLHDLVIDISRQHKCEFDLPENKTSCRRLLVHKNRITHNAISESSVRHQRFLRTISFSQNPEITSIPEHLFDRLRVLRVLDFSRTAILTLPRCVGKLKLLKVLNLSHTKIRLVPDCIRQLKALEYFDVSGCSDLQCLPDWIGDLHSLSHLNVLNCSDELTRHIPKGISNLLRLRTLRSQAFPLATEDNEHFLNVKDVAKLINLREMSFSFRDVGVLTSLEDGVLQRLVTMRNLRVENSILSREESNLPRFPQKMNVMTELQNLDLVSFSVPNWICRLANLTELGLSNCSGYSSLQNMPNLKTLVLSNDRSCRELPENFGKSGAFPKLVSLMILHFPVLEELGALEGAMQCLELLVIANCPQVKKVPEGLELLRRLKGIWISGASDQLKERLKEGGEDWNKLKAKNPHMAIYADL